MTCLMPAAEIVRESSTRCIVERAIYTPPLSSQIHITSHRQKENRHPRVISGEDLVVTERKNPGGEGRSDNPRHSPAEQDAAEGLVQYMSRRNKSDGVLLVMRIKSCRVVVEAGQYDCRRIFRRQEVTE